ncbi:auxin-induced protein 6B-like [Pyrus ussuriensis x Pyrus communis]|uniref:Auxin-induced protein 6B-like n=1 Tax=Pyrus ussuriensis x Pyrus communis TaxID=2448454 RepID=A0A5N5GDY6_9ROSA|nr:auxin-induced protein 6B-like [Pyrus ussuriensis x Pyrus communis]
MRIFIRSQCSKKVYIVLYVGERNKYQFPLNYLLDPTLQQVIRKSQRAGIWMFDAKIDKLIEAACTTNTFDQLLKIFKEY